MNHSLPEFTLTLISVGICFFIWNRFTFDSLDEGLLASAAMSMSKGKLLYRDVFEFWPPGLLSILTGCFSFFGAKFWVQRLLLSMFIVSSAIVFYRLQRAASTSLVVPFMSTLLFLIIDTSFIGLNNHWPAVLFLFLTALALTKALENSNQLLFFQSGILGGITLLFLQYEGAVALCGSVAAIMTSARVERWRRVRSFTWGAALLPVITLIFFISQGSGSKFIYATVVFPLTRYRGSNGSFPSVLGLFQCGLLLGLLLSLKGKLVKPIHRVLASFALCLEVANLSSGNWANVIWSSYFVDFFILMWIATLFRREKISVVLSLLTAALLFFNGEYLIPKVVTNIRSDANTSIPLSTAAGTILVTPATQEKVADILRWSDSHPANKVYFGPYSAYLFFFTGRLNPTGFSQLTVGYNTAAQFTEAIDDLRRLAVDTIFFLPSDSPFFVPFNHPLFQLIQGEYKETAPERAGSLEGRWTRK